MASTQTQAGRGADDVLLQASGLKLQVLLAPNSKFLMPRGGAQCGCCALRVWWWRLAALAAGIAYWFPYLGTKLMHGLFH
jgi:hypothetical protein